MDNKKPLDRVGITRNDEPTRFLTKEEMEQLEKMVFEPKNSTAKQVEEPRNSRIKIEDIATSKTKKSSIMKKSKSYSEKFQRMIKKVFMVLSVILVAILGFYLAFSLSLSLDDNEHELKKDKIAQEQVTKSVKTEQINKDNMSINELKQQAQAKLEVVQDNLNDVEQIADEAKSGLSTVEKVKSQAVEVKNSAEDLVAEHEDELAMLKLEVENLIKKFW